ncbi:MAG TPA: ABC transporter substrate-binding protein [Chloroflexota bacterium]|jgi:iron(III) transport system substrate-binding protein
MASVCAWRQVVASAGLVAVLACAPSAAPASAPGSAEQRATPASGANPAAAAGEQPPAAGGAAAPASAALQAIVDGARQEGQLVITWDSVLDTDVRQRLAAGFNRLYGLNVPVQWSAGISMPQMTTRVAQEQQAGRPAATDVLLGTEAHVTALLRTDTLLPVDYSSWASNLQDPRLVAPNGVAVELATRTPGMTYNTARLSGAAVPTSMQDLLKPEYKGRIASTIYAANFDRLASPQLWGRDRTIDYVTKLADQVAGLARCGEPERVASGEFDLLALDCGAEDAHSLQVKGAPVGHVIATDAALLSYWYLSVPRNAAHPNAAKLFVNYMMGREGQDLLYESDYLDHHLVPGSKTAPDVEKLQAAGVKFTENNVQFVQRDDASAVESVRAELQNILQKK